MYASSELQWAAGQELRRLLAAAGDLCRVAEQFLSNVPRGEPAHDLALAVQELIARKLLEPRVQRLLQAIAGVPSPEATDSR